MSIETAIALNRFGMGVKPGQALPTDPRKHLITQLDRFDPAPPVIAALPGGMELAKSYLAFTDEARKFREARKAAKDEAEVKKLEDGRAAVRGNLRDHYVDASNARLASALTTENGFAERLVHFWSNHFAVSVEKPLVITFAGDHEFGAIRPNIMGKFSDLLGAAVRHPAMLIYLDQAQSIGPNSPLAQRFQQRRSRQFGLNENLAREILELHTLGVRSGYSQADVTELARGLTGHTIAGLAGGPIGRVLNQQEPYGAIVFFDPIHEPGNRQMLGKSYTQTGKAQAEAMLSDLATHPATAKHIARKLATHFVSDSPPASLVAKLEKDFLDTGGDLPSLYRTLVQAPESWPQSWNGDAAKFKSPWDWILSSLRALEVDSLPGNGNIAGAFRQLGQPVWRPGSPAGFADNVQQWAGGAALLRRFEIAQRVARLSADRVDARALAKQILPGVLSANTAESIARAESPMQGLSLLLISPEFLRR